MKPSQDLPARLRAFEALERQHDLFSFRVDGWSAWRIIRNPVYRLVVGLPLSQPVRPAGIRSLEALGATFKFLWLILVGRQRELLVKTCRSALRMAQGRYFRDVYFDGLLQRGHSCLKLEDINSPDFAREAAAAWRPADLNPVVFTFWGRVLGHLFPVDAAAFCKSVSDLTLQELKIEVKPRWILMRLSTVYWQVRLYEVLLARIRPHAVLVSDSGEYAISIASRRRRVRFIELQHGVFDAHHPDAVPSWVEGTAAELVLPDILACRGDFWIEQLATTRQGCDHAAAVGDELIDLARQRRLNRTRGDGFHLVLTSQGLDTARLVQWIEQMKSSAPSALDWRLSIKLHPLYDANTREFDALKSHARVRVIGGAEQPNVFDLLSEADLHLSIASACHFDAAALAVPSVIIPLAGHETLLSIADGTQFIVAHSPADVWTIASRMPPDLDRMYRFCKPDFVDNLEKLIECSSAREHLDQRAQQNRHWTWAPD